MHELYFQSTDRALTVYSVELDAALHISKPDGDLSIERGLADKAFTRHRSIIGVVGMLQLRLSKYLILATAAKPTGRVMGSQNVSQVTKFETIPLRQWRVKDDNEQQYLDLLKSHLESSQLFFSYTYDLTRSVQVQVQAKSGQIFEPDPRFMWNRFAAEPFQSVAPQFILPLLNGVVSLTDTFIAGTPVQLGLISRRSQFRAGTRYFRRGIDAEGNVANFNETEQILVVGSRVFSYVQTRGSVPVFWGEVNNLRYRPMLRIASESPVDAATRHFTQQVALYGTNYLVNLVNQSGYEAPVKQAYEAVFRNVLASSQAQKQGLNSASLHYTYFDFHHECSKMRWHRVDLLIGMLEKQGLSRDDWFEGRVSEKTGNLETIRTQKSVVRTNCMDCLDRTNVVQSQLARWVLQAQLETAGVVAVGRNWSVADPRFEIVFRNRWADNADGVSKAYSGTGALKTDFTRLGKRTRTGALSDLRNSIVRYLLNNYFDGSRQDGYDLFLGNHRPYESVEAPFGDHRPLWLQSIPYFVLGSLFMISAAILFPKQDTPKSFNRAFLVAWSAILVVCSYLMVKNGLQYVNWPRLVALDFVGLREVVKNGDFRGLIMVEKGGAVEGKRE